MPSQAAFHEAAIERLGQVIGLQPFLEQEFRLFKFPGPQQETPGLLHLPEKIGVQSFPRRKNLRRLEFSLQERLLIQGHRAFGERPDRVQGALLDGAGRPGHMRPEGEGIHPARVRRQGEAPVLQSQGLMADQSAEAVEVGAEGAGGLVAFRIRPERIAQPGFGHILPVQGDQHLQQLKGFALPPGAKREWKAPHFDRKGSQCEHPHRQMFVHSGFRRR